MQKDIGRWLRAGLIDAATADRLARDVAAQTGRSISFGSILAILAAVLFAAALLVWAGAEWDSIPRGVRTGIVAALIVIDTGGGFVLRARGNPGFAQAAWLVACAAFGAEIILVGGLAGQTLGESTVLLIWCLGTALAAAAFPSGPLNIAATGLAAAWLGVSAPPFGRPDDAFPFAFPLLGLGLWLVSLRTESRRARDLLLLSLLLYCVLLAQPFGSLPAGTAMSVGFGLLFAFAARWPERTDGLLRVDGHAPVHFLLGCFLGLALIQGELLDRAGFATAAAVTLAAVAAALLVGGRRSAGVRRLAYVTFVAETCVLFGVTVGSALDTVSFFLAAAALLTVLAVVVLRLERRWQRLGGAAGLRA